MIKIYQGNSLDVLQRLPDESVHCVVTSPPYWQLRNYEVDGQIGLEPTINEFIDTLVKLFREIKRVLHKSGTLWVNMGDSYNSAQTRGTWGNQSKHGYLDHGASRSTIKNLHSKNLVGQPWRLAFALQDDGWILRSDIIWHKTNPMPSSVTDRPTPAHEYLFLFSKSSKYFYDHLAIREVGEHCESRNKRTVWSIPTEAFADAHFATYPTRLVTPCILAGTSEKGCCPKCFTPWTFILKRDETKTDPGKPRKRANAPGSELSSKSMFRTRQWSTYSYDVWAPACKCDAGEPIPCTVLDPFHGSGTTGLVAARLNRNYVGIELNPEYIEISKKRLNSDRPLFNKVEVIA